ncbi:hypothetical protein HK101_004484, partial [Irineochytrium annulatum]
MDKRRAPQVAPESVSDGSVTGGGQAWGGSQYDYNTLEKRSAPSIRSNAYRYSGEGIPPMPTAPITAAQYNMKPMHHIVTPGEDPVNIMTAYNNIDAANQAQPVMMHVASAVVTAGNDSAASLNSSVPNSATYLVTPETHDIAYDAPRGGRVNRSNTLTNRHFVPPAPALDVNTWEQPHPYSANAVQKPEQYTVINASPLNPPVAKIPTGSGVEQRTPTPLKSVLRTPSRSPSNYSPSGSARSPTQSATHYQNLPPPSPPLPRVNSERRAGGPPTMLSHPHQIYDPRDSILTDNSEGDEMVWMQPSEQQRARQPHGPSMILSALNAVSEGGSPVPAVPQPAYSDAHRTSSPTSLASSAAAKPQLQQPVNVGYLPPPVSVGSLDAVAIANGWGASRDLLTGTPSTMGSGAYYTASEAGESDAGTIRA